MWAKRQQEIAPALSKVTNDSISSALQSEYVTTQVSGDDNGITISVDGAWQSRGSGRGYNSASGHVTAVGKHTGKCVGYSVRPKACRVCHIARKKKVPPKKHNCVHNWDGSSKAMKPDMVIEIIRDTTKNGVAIKRIVGDEDSTAIARARREVGK